MSVPTWTGATAFENTHASDGPPAIHNITNLPGLGDVTDMHMTSGYLPVDGGKKYIFYWYIPVDASTGKSPDEVPLVLWFTGGPGCSGLYDHFQCFENFQIYHVYCFAFEHDACLYSCKSIN